MVNHLKSPFIIYLGFKYAHPPDIDHIWYRESGTSKWQSFSLQKERLFKFKHYDAFVNYRPNSLTKEQRDRILKEVQGINWGYYDL